MSTEVSLSQAFAVLDRIGARPDDITPANDITVLERQLGLRLPESYRQFVTRYGHLSSPDGHIFGLGTPPNRSPSVLWALFCLRMSSKDVPVSLLPILSLGKRTFGCLHIEHGAADVPIVQWQLGVPADQQQLDLLYPNFATLLHSFVRTLEARLQIRVQDRERWFRAGLEQLHWHVQNRQFDWNHASGGKLPRNHLWRPYRFCVQDVLFGTTVVRHAREYNGLEVDVFLTAEIPQYEPLSGTRALAMFLLSEAFKCGGSMEIRFTDRVEGGRIPESLSQLAERVRAPFGEQSVAEGRISPLEARNLFAGLTGFSSRMRARIRDLTTQGRLSVERACYSVHHGIWTLPEMESLVLSSPYPDLVLSGDVQPEQRHLYTHVLHHARTSLLGGFLDRKLALREHVDETGAAFDLEDDERYVRIDFEADSFAKRYSCPDEHLPLAWLVTPERLEIRPGHTVVVLVRARDAVGLRNTLVHDIDFAAERSLQEPSQQCCVLVPFDFRDPLIPDAERQAMIQHAAAKRVGLMVCPESVSTLDAEARKRLMSSRIMRE